MPRSDSNPSPETLSEAFPDSDRHLSEGHSLRSSGASLTARYDHALAEEAVQCHCVAEGVEAVETAAAHVAGVDIVAVQSLVVRIAAGQPRVVQTVAARAVPGHIVAAQCILVVRMVVVPVLAAHIVAAQGMLLVHVVAGRVLVAIADHTLLPRIVLVVKGAALEEDYSLVAKTSLLPLDIGRVDN